MGLSGILRRLLRDRRGATAVEYALILALIFLALVTSLSSLGGATGGLWDHVSGKVVGRSAD